MKRFFALLLCAAAPLVSASSNFEAYKVGIDKYDAVNIRFMDGSDAVYVGKKPLDAYYLDEVVIYRDGSDWHFCFDGSRYLMPELKLPTSKKVREYLDITYNDLDSLSACY
ncbi:hypothetical protein LMH73_024295 [Vibrio splendidus]|nr:hypothetical protein [Vibrio splendidus]MCC4880868.1 hypothetical protein [Vibrio splendidus]